ncbi:ethanolamine permease [Arenibaculum pallidiluteum]|uniref:ethanolamine permease n=1 Tax=Arenibaculum pallidiluteum TaxID=2812559 RepID=UPI001A97CD1F|nr:ethanolamine permease [Arenibaculum pallidiluteum]
MTDPSMTGPAIDLAGTTPAGTDQRKAGGVTYNAVDSSYFERRGLKRYAGVWSLWALGVGAVISGHFSGWNLGLSVGGFGGMMIATLLIMTMYLGLCFCIAEMSPALPHTGGAYSFSRTAMGPWGGFVTGLAENMEFILTPAVIVFFIGSYLGSIFGTGPGFQPVWWVGAYLVFVGLNLVGVELSFRLSLVVTLLALGVLAVFWISAAPHFEFSRWALNVGLDAAGQPVELAEGGGAFLPFGLGGALAAMPFAVWLFLAIEQLPLAAEEAVDPKRDMPRGLILGICTLILSAFLVLFLNSGIPNGAFALGKSGEPLLDGFKAIYGDSIARILALVAVVGLIASFHTIIFAYGRQIYSLSRAGYFPSWLSVTHGTRKTPHVALVAGGLAGLAVLIIVWVVAGAERGAAFIGGTLLNMAVFGAMISYIMQATAFIRLRRKLPHIQRPYLSPLGIPGAVATIVIAAVTIYFQLLDPVYRAGVIGAAIWYLAGLSYFALVGRHKLILSPEEEFALSGGQAGHPG